ncbi:unnamed protein product [Oppiella nova]|uniref:G-protein coupled receptors family 1 profile domain-containing protein n=1 Tax=Oppiella nova TaxID=334625 RepID=A0A7R9QCW8_9ACAR|nr:unnamed protein product [Oppiella nova]CAG2163392.1 unnamed protein product [Oppiella nova]
MRREFQVAKNAAIITMVFIVCSVPFNIIHFNSDERTFDFKYLVHWEVSLWILLINSTLNPIIYDYKDINHF